MYCKHFSFREDPFSVSPDSRFFFQTAQHREAVATLYYAILQRRGFALLVGRPGLGKTTVLSRLAVLLEETSRVAFLPQPYFNHVSLLPAILLAFGVEPKKTLAQNHLALNDFLLKTKRSGKNCVVMFDEAQNLSVRTLEAIRMLSNFETPTQKLIQIVMSGQPKLSELLKQPKTEQIRQRINVVSRLNPLVSYEVSDYVAYRLRIAGGSIRVFDPAALRAISLGSGGIPRNINTICFNALSVAFALNRDQVGCSEVDEAIRDLDLSAAEVHTPPSPLPQEAPVPLYPRPAASFGEHAFAMPRVVPDVQQMTRGMRLHSTFDQALTALRRKVSNHE